MIRRFGLWIGGEYVETADVDPIYNPYTGEIFAEACLAGESEIDRAIDAAVKAFETLRSLSRGRRAEILYGIAHGIRTHRDELAVWLVQETGKPIDACDAEISRAVSTFTFSAEEAIRNTGEVVGVDLTEANRSVRGMYEYFPIGPVAAITPFNFPLNLSAHKIGPAIAASNPVILKPAVQCPTLLYRFAEIAQEAGLTPGALNVVHCKPPSAERLATDERIKLLSFTGSAKVGWHLKSIAGKKKVLLEMGGNAGAAVHEDANLPRAAKRLALGAFYQSGQVCISAQRIFVHKNVAQEFTEQFLKETKALTIGDPMNRGTVIGPMIDEASARRVVEWVEEAKASGAEVLLEGKRKGTILSPYVLTRVPTQAKVCCEEVFGPVVVLEEYQEFEEALDRINSGCYGLQASVFTKDIHRIDRAFRKLDVGGVIVNDFPNFRTDNYPYGGVKDSGLGREGIRYAIREMTETKMLVVNLDS